MKYGSTGREDYATGDEGRSRRLRTFAVAGALCIGATAGIVGGSAVSANSGSGQDGFGWCFANGSNSYSSGTGWTDAYTSSTATKCVSAAVRINSGAWYYNTGSAHVSGQFRATTTWHGAISSLKDANGNNYSFSFSLSCC